MLNSAPIQQPHRGPWGVDRHMSLQPPLSMPQEPFAWAPDTETKLTTLAVISKLTPITVITSIPVYALFTVTVYPILVSVYFLL